jgi:hypothetical protein
MATEPYGQYLNLTAVLRAKRCASKPGCDRAIAIIASIAAIMTAGSIFCLAHSRNGSCGVGKFRIRSLSGTSESLADFEEGCGSAILRTDRPQFRISRFLVGCQQKGRHLLAARPKGNFESEISRSRSNVFRKWPCKTTAWPPITKNGAPASLSARNTGAKIGID